MHAVKVRKCVKCWAPRREKETERAQSSFLSLGPLKRQRKGPVTFPSLVFPLQRALQELNTRAVTVISFFFKGPNSRRLRTQ